MQSFTSQNGIGLIIGNFEFSKKLVSCASMHYIAANVIRYGVYSTRNSGIVQHFSFWTWARICFVVWLIVCCCLFVFVFMEGGGDGELF